MGHSSAITGKSCAHIPTNARNMQTLANMYVQTDKKKQAYCGKKKLEANTKDF